MWDILIQDKVIELHQDGWNYCDVGSCQGIHTNLFLSLRPNKVYAFDILDTNPRIPGAINERLAISDIDGFEKMFYNGSHESNLFAGNSSKKIGSIRLDTYFKGKELDCIKMDIEGSELKALRGGLETINKCKLVLIECHWDEDWLEIYNIIKNMGFKNLVNNEPVFYGECEKIEGRSNNGRPYQMYKNK